MPKFIFFFIKLCLFMLLNKTGVLRDRYGKYQKSCIY